MYCGKITSVKVGTSNTVPVTEMVAGELVAVKLSTVIVPLYEPAGVPTSLTEIVVVATVGAGKDNEELQVKPPLLEYSYPATALIVNGSVKNWPATVNVLIADGVGLFVVNVFDGVKAVTVIIGICGETVPEAFKLVFVAPAVAVIACKLYEPTAWEAANLIKTVVEAKVPPV